MISSQRHDVLLEFKSLFLNIAIKSFFSNRMTYNFAFQKGYYVPSTMFLELFVMIKMIVFIAEH